LFRDTEEISQALRHTNVRAMQITRGSFEASLTHVPAGEWLMQFLSFEEGASVCAGDAPRHHHAVVVPLESSPECRLLGQPISPHTLAVYAPGSEHADTTSAGYREVVIIAPLNFAERMSEEGVTLAKHGAESREVVRRRLEPLQNLVRRAWRSAEEPGHPLDWPEAQRCLTDALDCAVSDVLRPDAGISQDGAALGRPRLPRTAILRRIFDLLNERTEEPLYAGRLAAEVGISRPSLQRVFLEFYGMPPARYLTLKRLYLARQRLREGDKATVTAVAASLGFWDLSRFAKNYRDVFGELPSDTLRRSRRTADQPHAALPALDTYAPQVAGRAE
jgi:AraC-like DNA-binding protein